MSGTLKDKITNVCGIIIAVGGGLLGAVASGQLTLPEVWLTVIGAVVAVSTAIVAFLTGKTGDGKAKKV